MKIMASGPIISWQIDGEKWKQWQTLFSWAPKSLQMVTAAMKLKDNCSLKEKLWQTFTAFWKQRCHFADKGPYSQTYGFSSSQVRMWELDNKKAGCQSCDAFESVGEESWESLIWQGNQTCQSWWKWILNIHSKDWCWISNTLATWCEWPTHWKRPWCWESLKAGVEREDRGWDNAWHHQFNIHEFEQTLGDSEGPGSLACCSPWGCKESDTTKRLNTSHMFSWEKCFTSYPISSFIFI